MTEIADDRSWWADVEHLRPGGEGDRTADDRAESADGHGEDLRPASLSARTVHLERDSPRPGRITGLPVDHSSVRTRRPDVAAFADALDLDGAFGAPVPAPRSREIILTGTPVSAHGVDLPSGSGEDDALERADRSDADSGADGHPDADAAERKTVRITGNPGLHAQVTERRALREIGDRRPRSTVQRAVHHPDRIAMYVVLLGLFLVFVAAFTSSAGS